MFSNILSACIASDSDKDIKAPEQQEQLPEKKSPQIKIGSWKTSFVSFGQNIIIEIEKDQKNTELKDEHNDLLEENDDCKPLENGDKISKITFSPFTYFRGGDPHLLLQKMDRQSEDHNKEEQI